MPRRRVAAKREILPDPKFGSEILSRFMNVVMVDGKKSKAEKVVYGALDKVLERIGGKAKSDFNVSDESSAVDANNLALMVFEKALKNIRPSVEVRSRHVGGATYQIPVEVRPDRSRALAMRWLSQYAKKGAKKSGMMLSLADEIVSAYEGRGEAIKKREDTHKMAEANKAFGHFRWN